METDTRTLIIEFLQKNGPSIPVHIAKAIGMNSLFTGAFLSEICTTKEIRMSHMKVGNTPVYLIPGQEALLENYQKNIKGKEKEALLLLKEKGILEDNDQEPAIRVALRNLKDFAIPTKEEDKIIWRYFIQSKEPLPEPETKPIEEIKAPAEKSEPTPEPQEIIEPAITAEKLKELAEKEIEKELKQETPEEETPEEIPKEPIKAKISKPIIKKPVKKTSPKDKFLEQIQRYLKEKEVNVIRIEKHDKKQIVARVAIQDQAYVLAAFNKKRFDESDLLKVYRKYNDEELPFYFLSKGEISKKTTETIKASKRLKAVGIFEE